MRIGIDARSLDVEKKAGIGIFIETVIKLLNDNKDNNEYILYSNTDINLPYKLNNNFYLKNFHKKHAALWYKYELPKILYEDKIDVFWGTQHTLPNRNKYTKKIRFVLNIHDLANFKIKNIGDTLSVLRLKFFVKKSCKIADEIMAISNSTKRDLIEIMNVDEKKIKVVYLGTNIKDDYILTKKAEDEILKKFRVKKNKFLFFISTIEPRKNIITLVKAFNKLKTDKKYQDYKLLLAGGLGWKYEPILEEIKKSEYSSDIIMPGYISTDEKQCLFHNCTCFVYPSLYEGFGLPVLEAFANESVVVTSNVSSLPEVGKDAALYFDNVLDYNELCLRIEEAINLPIKIKNKKLNRGKKITKEFTWEKCTMQILKELTK